MIRLENRRVRLTEITESDLELLHTWRNSEDFMTYCTVRRQVVTREEFRDELISDFENDRHVQMLISKKRDECPIGTIYSYNLNEADGHVFITTYLDHKYRQFGYGAIALSHFMLYLFENYGLYKVYTEVYSYNHNSLNSLRGGGFLEEGRFKGHKKYRGERHDLVRLSFFREKLSELRTFVRVLSG